MLGTNQGVSFSGNKVECPYCGKMGYVPDGTYSSVKGVVHVLANSWKSAHQMDALAGIIREARGKNSTPEEVETEIKEQLPELSSLASYFPKTRNEFYAFLGILLAALAVFVGIATPFLSHDQSLNKEQIEEIVNRAVMKAANEKTSDMTGKARKKVGRNEPCPCGSGKKYKKCCLNAP
jgi:preprotein translocase subunit SecA